MTVSKRRRGRQMAVQMLYQLDLGRAPLEDVMRHFQPEEYLPEQTPDTAATSDVDTSPADVGPEPDELRARHYAEQLVRGSLDHRSEIDEIIAEQAENWRLERMPVVDRNILRLAVYELLYEEDVPHLVVVDEAIELAKEFGSEQSSRFINGLLDGVLKSRPLPGSDR